MSKPPVSASDLQRADGQAGRPLWVCVDGDVLDVTRFAEFHPGGRAVLERVGGKDASREFRLFHDAGAVLAKYRDKLLVGQVEAEVRKVRAARELVEQRRAFLLPEGAFGDQIPFADPCWYQRQVDSPYYKDSHRKFRGEVREFVDKHILATMSKWKADPQPPREVMLEMGRRGYLAMMVGGPPFPSEYVDPGTASPPEDFDFFHILILYDEISRCGDAGVISALTNGPSIACAAICKYGSPELKRKVLPDVLMGRRFIALGVTEPGAGSDVSGLSLELMENPATGQLTVRGVKKFITNGTYSGFVTLLCKDVKRGGLTLVVVETRTPGDETPVPGFEARKLAIKGTGISGTALLDFTDVHVPIGHVLGERGQGFKMQMESFNYERFYVVVSMVRLSRVCIEECMKQCMIRQTFGKKLYQHQAVRMRLAEMIRDVESVHAWMESVAFQMGALNHDRARAALALGDVIGSLKVHAAYVYERCARHACHIFGGLSLQENSRGALVEAAATQVKAYLIPAGASDILDDYTVRQAFKIAEQVARL